MGDPVFLFGVSLYAVNRWVVKPHCALIFFHSWFNDLLLIPCALPPLLLTHRWLGLRRHDGAPTGGEIAAHWLGWSILFEGIGPRIMRTTGDPWDVAAYAAGALGAWVWWTNSHRKLVPPPEVANFDWLAAHYRWMEWVLAGSKLQRCRTAFLATIPRPRRVLLLGEGNGRFLAAFCRQFPEARVTCVDASPRMLQQARARLQRAGGFTEKVEFVTANVGAWDFPVAEYDLIVTHFFLDCFRPDQLDELIPKIAASGKAGAHWLVADFCRAPQGWRRWRSGLILSLMYWFFERFSRLPARELTEPDRRIQTQGFHLEQRQSADWELLHTDLWVKSEGAGKG